MAIGLFHYVLVILSKFLIQKNEERHVFKPCFKKRFIPVWWTKEVNAYLSTPEPLHHRDLTLSVQMKKKGVYIIYLHVFTGYEDDL